MKTVTNTETGLSGAGAQQDCAPTKPQAQGRTLHVWILATASVAVIVFIYFFAFRAAHEAQIREVPLVTKGGRP